jgi:Tfp pilus assembly protein PilX
MESPQNSIMHGIQDEYSFSHRQGFASHFCGYWERKWLRINYIFKIIFFAQRHRPSFLHDQRGVATAIGLLLLAVLTLLGTTAVVFTSTDIQISGNYKVSEVAFFAAEAGIEEARARLRSTAEANLINDSYPTSTQWRAYIGTLARSQTLGFNPSLSTHSRTGSLQSSMSYVVEIKHKTDAIGNIMYWGDDNTDGIVTRNTTVGDSNNRNIYLVTSSGYTGNSYRTVEAEMAKVPPITVPAPLYVKSNATIQGSSTDIIGTDGCGGADKPGVITTKAPGSIDINGGPNITGVGGTTPNIIYNGLSLDIDSMVNSLKTLANYSYTKSGTDTGMNWGTPTSGLNLESPTTCDDHNIVYYNTNGATIMLAGGSSGCGILLIEGNLEVHGGFSWNGVILITGSVKYSGGGNKQVTGGVLSGGTVDADLVGGNANIVYCSTAVTNQTANLPLKILSWRDAREGN